MFALRAELGVGPGLVFAALQERRLDQDAAVRQRANRHQRLQRGDVDALAEGDGDGVQHAPVLRDKRLGGFRQFGAQPGQMAHLAQKRLVALDADHHGDACRADV